MRLYLAGNFTQMGDQSPYSFDAQPGHTTVLNGTGEQIIYFKNQESCFGTLEATNDEIEIWLFLGFHTLNSDLHAEGWPMLYGQDIALNGDLHGGLFLLKRESTLIGGAECPALLILDGGIQREGQVLFPAFEVYAESVPFNAYVAPGAAFQLHHALEGGVDGRCAQLHVNVVILQDGLPDAEAGLGRLVGLQGFRRFSADGDAEVKMLRSVLAEEFPEGEGDAVGLSGLEGAFVGDEAERVAAVLFCGTLDRGLELEQGIRLDVRHFLFREDDADDRIFTHDTSGVRFYVSRIILGRRGLRGLFGSAGRQGGKPEDGCGKEYFTHDQ